MGLERLDRVTVTIRDDRPDRGRHVLPGGPTAPSPFSAGRNKTPRRFTGNQSTRLAPPNTSCGRSPNETP
jgi:hypothetical protein